MHDYVEKCTCVFFFVSFYSCNNLAVAMIKLKFKPVFKHGRKENRCLVIDTWFSWYNYPRYTALFYIDAERQQSCV